MIFDYTPFFSGAYIDWSKNALAKAQKIFPNVNPNGLNWYDKYQTESDLWKESDWAMISLCREFFLEVKKVKKPDWSSYGIKHQIEKHYTMNGDRVYVHNGATIVAALACDIPYKVYSNMSLLLGVSHFYATKKMTQTKELDNSILFDL
jgi:ribosomal protein S24E